MLVAILITYVTLSVAACVIVLAACVVAGRSDTRRAKLIKHHVGRDVSISDGRLATRGHRTRGNSRLVWK